MKKSRTCVDFCILTNFFEVHVGIDTEFLATQNLLHYSSKSMSFKDMMILTRTFLVFLARVEPTPMLGEAGILLSRVARPFIDGLKSSEAFH